MLQPGRAMRSEPFVSIGAYVAHTGPTVQHPLPMTTSLTVVATVIQDSAFLPARKPDWPARWLASVVVRQGVNASPHASQWQGMRIAWVRNDESVLQTIARRAVA